MDKYIHYVLIYYSAYLIAFAVAFIGCVIFTIITHYRKKRNNWIKIEILLMLMCFFGTAVTSYDVIRDVNCIKNGDIETAYFTEAGFDAKGSDEGDLLASPVVAKLQNGEELFLKDVSGFPEEVRNGTVTYLEKSSLILDYTGEIIKK